jgi:phosphoadenosine phosphosulfate reductase
VKANPLLDWTRDDLASYIRAEEIPYNPLHDKGFASIGCAPCTRTIRVGEPERAGRWWWEEDTKKECGLHIRDGKVVRGPVEEAA